MATESLPELSDELLHRLIWEQAFPVVKRIVRFRVPSSAVEDVCQNVAADLIARLRMQSKEVAAPAIRDLGAYAAAAAQHGCNEYFRQSFPMRYRLRHRVRYLLAKCSNFHLWRSTGGEWLCGLREHPAGGRAPVWESARETAHHLQAVLEGSGVEMPLDIAVEQVGRRMGIYDQCECDPDLLISQAPSIYTELERRDRIEVIWQEIRQLPAPQRVALLLNLRDEQGGPALVLLPIIGIASIREIAEILKMPAEELARLWSRLPLDDHNIAGLLGLKRQQVINLRKSARERLTRRITVSSRHPGI